MKKARRALVSIAASPRPSPAFAIALVALLVALGGTAWAVPQANPPASKPNVTVIKTGFSVSNGQVNEGVARCPGGTKVLGGGYASTGQHAKIFVSAPARRDNGYVVDAVVPPVNINAGVLKETATITVVAYCAPIGKPVVFG